MIVCTLCGGLSGPDPHHPDSVQHCYCTTHGPSPTWPGHDFPRHAELCATCAAVVIPSGTRWSLLLCDGCRHQAHLVNLDAGTVVVPIGRHSLMHARYTRNAASPAALPNLLGGLRAGLDDLRQWRALLVTTRHPNVDTLELDNYIAGCAEHPIPRRALVGDFVAYRQRLPI
jgi:hypothetical protein